MSNVEHHHVVNLEHCHTKIQPFALPQPHTYVEHHKTQPGQVLERIRDATIVVTTILPIKPEIAAQCPRLKLVVVSATGCGWVEKEGFAALGITVVNCPSSNLPAVSEHAIMLMLSARRRLIELHQATTSSREWAENETLTPRFPKPPRSCAEENLVIIGYGNLGHRIENLARGMGVQQIIIADRKGLTAAEVRPGRVAFDHALQQASVVMVCCPRDASTINLIDEAELESMQRDVVVISVARGGIINELALVKALREGWIAGAATDVFDGEPAVLGQSPLLPLDGKGVPGLTVTPHTSWYTQRTVDTLGRLVKDAIEGWVLEDASRYNLIVDPSIKTSTT